jgi:hypothetical protein
MITLKWPLHKYVVVFLRLFLCCIKAQIRPMWMETIVGELFLMLFIIVVIGNMLGNTFGNPLGIFKNIMGTLWELKETPGEHHGNHFETLKKIPCAHHGNLLGT